MHQRMMKLVGECLSMCHYILNRLKLIVFTHVREYINGTNIRVKLRTFSRSIKTYCS